MLYKSLVVFLLVLVSHSFGFASEQVAQESNLAEVAAHQAPATPETHATEANHADAAEHGEKEEGLTPMIMHHIADANEFQIWGDLVMPLPVMIYNKDKKNWFIGNSSEFHSHHGDGTKEVDGYVMSHSRVHPADGSQYIDFSITKNVFVMLLSLVVLFIMFLSLKSAYKKRDGQAPSGMQGLLEPIIEFVTDDIAKSNIPGKYHKFVPYLICTFFFILMNNLLGLLPLFPGSANVSGNISFTFMLALIAFIMININGTRDYWGHIFKMPGVPIPLLIILTPLEILGIFIKPIALMLRLFGNITGGHIAILSIVSMVFVLGKMGESIGGAVAGGFISIPLLIFVNAMELFVAFLQAYVFTLLTAIFIGQALEEHSSH